MNAAGQRDQAAAEIVARKEAKYQRELRDWLTITPRTSND
jgi:hypothetical protein